MKALVLARGKGTRMQRADQGATPIRRKRESPTPGLKAMIPFRRPFLDYILSALADAGCLDICLVIGPEHDAVRDYYERTHPPERARVPFAIQTEARGTADAVLSAEAFAGASTVPGPQLRQLLSCRGAAGARRARRPGAAGVPPVDAHRAEQYRSRTASAAIALLTIGADRHAAGHRRKARPRDVCALRWPYDGDGSASA